MARKQRSDGARIARMVVIDVLALGIALCTFSYFHHVRQPAVKPVALPTPPQAAATPTPPPIQTAELVLPSESPNANETVPPELEPTSEPAGLLRGQYAEKFSAEGVVQDATSYRSQNVALELTQERMYDSLVHIVDVYIQDITSFHTVACAEAFGKNKTIAQMEQELPGALTITSSDQFRNRNKGQWGLIVSDGMLYSDKTNVYDFGVLFLDGTMEVYYAGETDLQSLAQRGIRQAWTFGPALVKDGVRTESYDGAPARMQSKNPRVAIGYYEPGHYCLVMVDGTRGSDSDSQGATLDELTELFLTLGCTEALNLDGGGTVGMSFGGNALNTGGRALTNAIYISEPDTVSEGGN